MTTAPGPPGISAVFATLTVSGRPVLVQQARDSAASGTTAYRILDGRTGRNLNDRLYPQPPALDQITAAVPFAPERWWRRSRTLWRMQGWPEPDVPDLDEPPPGPELTNAALLDLVADELSIDAHDNGGASWVIETVEDVDRLQYTACTAIPHGYTHPIQHIFIWPNADEPDALITRDLPCGLRIASFLVSAREFTNPEPRQGSRANLAYALTELLIQGRRLADDHAHLTTPTPTRRHRTR